MFKVGDVIVPKNSRSYTGTIYKYIDFHELYAIKWSDDVADCHWDEEKISRNHRLLTPLEELL